MIYMILFVSGRTDIVAFYTKWFMKRIEEGFVMVRNPFNPKLVSKIDFDCVLYQKSITNYFLFK